MDCPTAAFGPFRVAVIFPPGRDSGRTSWLDPPGVPADIKLNATLDGTPRSDAGLRFTRFDDDGFAFLSAHALVQVDWRTGTGTATLATDDDDPRSRPTATMEAMFGVAYAKVLRAGGVVLHAATLAYEGRVWVVAGYSGAGKTTLSGRFPDQALHDEHAFLVPGDDGWVVWRHVELRRPRAIAPWVVPVGGLSILSSNRSVTGLRPVVQAEQFASLVPHAVFAGGATRNLVLEHLLNLTQDCPPAWLDHCLKDSPEVVASTVQGLSDG